ncbi:MULTISPECIES: LysR family transcriptional regulator [Roseobacteraceae]|uniref:LysR family transcriptional regulator n=1 Tax=Roseobacteraceae TaxID=2854170 RepID=UPI00080AA6C3|nr:MULTISPECIES: LysR family transcriptional regulator [Roseobacteraceae]ANT60634.1 LysR family transcriptional regulator [Salipiger sp. CCB-MM3]MCA0995969.1 LysR family transcriptional regulator [Alloyangia pacifica]NDV98515.1 LysR family transcriptional regulator [Salipiger sp. PrR002]NDW57350.1 LysR family transcriptional regulator [Salipiger sp. PrR004]
MIPKLEMFIALAREQHFGRAAVSLGITQPTLSTGIRQLEEQLGVKLVQRGSRFGGLTPEGQRALVWARQIVGDTRRLRDEMRASREGLAGHLRLAVIPTALTWASTLAAQFNRRHPRVTFTVLSRASADILSMLDDLEIDAGISYLDNEPLGRVTTRPLYREAYRLVCRDDHPLAGRAELSWRELAGLNLCLLTPEMQNRRIINRQFMEAGIEPSSAIESNSTVVLVSNVLMGDWVTILPTDLATFLAEGKPLALVPMAEDSRAHEVGLIAPWQEPYTPVLQALLDEAKGLARPG